MQQRFAVNQGVQSPVAIASGVLQRKCACGNHTIAGDKCDDCSKKSRLQRKLAIGASNDPLEAEADRIAHQAMTMSAGQITRSGPPRISRLSTTSDRHPDVAPPSVDRALASPGRPLETALRLDMERRFGYDFSRVRVHANRQAIESARDVSAYAYTVGHDIVFGDGQYAPHTPAGRNLLAHELVHVAQQSESQVSRKVQRLGFFESIGVFLGISEGDYSPNELFEYLRIISLSGKIEGSYDSDNKARDVVRKWRSGKLDIDLFPVTRKLLIQEMQDGVVLDGDREGIMTLLENSNNRDLREIFSPGGVDPKQLRKDLDSGNFKKRLESFFNTRFEGGADALVEKKVVKPVGGVDLKKLSPEKRREFIDGHFEKGDRKFAMQILDDLTESADELDFSDEKELAAEIEKRMRTSRLMQETQKLFGRAFEYPNKEAAKGCLPENKGKKLHEQKSNPRVNEAAKDYWGPVQEGSPAPNHPPSYYFELTQKGKESAYQALTELFTPQDSICKMTLIHCDYLASVVHFRTFAETIGVEEFNDRVRKGLLDMKLTYFGFQYLEPYLARSGKSISLQEVQPASEDDLIIGDHVIFWNHRAYDLINSVIHNAWRLENAILTERKGKEDYFLGHGSGKHTKATMKEKLKEEYNEVVKKAEPIIDKTKSKNATIAASARHDMDTQFPAIKEVAGEWKIIGFAHGKMFNDPLKRIQAIDPELIGLRDPDNPSKMNWVKRPVESR
jgi:hypothetical protein